MARDIHVLVPRTWEYIMLHIKGMKGADEIKVADQMILRWIDYPGLSEWAQCNPKGS